MNYTELTEFVVDALEDTFTANQLKVFVQQAEQKIYETVQLPALRKSCDGTTTDANEFLSVPDDFLHMHSVAVDDGSGSYDYLTQVDPNFVREAYPDRTVKGTPKYYGHFDVDSLILGPTPDAYYTVRITYGYRPESIVTAGTTWLGTHFDSALLNGTMVEAYRFLKGEEDMMMHYEKSFADSMTLLKQLGDGKLRQDSYRSGQVRQGVR